VSELVELVIAAGHLAQLGSSLLAELLEPLGERIFPAGATSATALRKRLQISVGRR
jgi:hypothetical protein